MPTINDVARQAGVSAGTVSRVINGMSNVTPEIRERVERAIADLEYVPNVFARSLRSRRASSISVIVPDITNHHWRDLMRGAEDAAHSRGYVVLLCDTYDNPLKQRRYLETAASQNVAGVVIAPYDSILDDLSPLIEKGVPTVLVNRRLEGWQGDGVYSDNLSGARALTSHLIQLGHRRIAMIAGRRQISTVVERIQGYCMALEEAGLPVDPRLVKSEFRLPSSGERQIEDILDEFERDEVFPDATFVWNNGLASRLLQALNRRGLRVPQDMAVVCFGDSTDMYFPFLTCVREPAHEIGINAVQLLFDRLENGPEAPQRELVLPTHLVVRYSCGAQLGVEPNSGISLMIPPELPEQIKLVQAVSHEEKQRRADSWRPLLGQPIQVGSHSATAVKPDVKRLVEAFRFLRSDRPPMIEFVQPQAGVIQMLLKRSPEVKSLRAPGEIQPEEHVELAYKLGMDAVVCDFSWMPPAGSLRTWVDLDRLEALVSPTDQVTRLERYLSAVKNQGIGVGVGVNSPGFACHAAGWGTNPTNDPPPARLLETVMDILQEQQQSIIRLVCDRFSDRLAFIAIRDFIPASASGTQPALLEGLLPRLDQMLAPAREHELPVILSTSWSRAANSLALHSAGVRGVLFEGASCEQIVAWQKDWYGKLVLVGGIPEDILISGSPAQVEETITSCINHFSAMGGYIFAVTERVVRQAPAARYLELVQWVCRSTRVVSGASDSAPVKNTHQFRKEDQ